MQRSLMADISNNNAVFDAEAYAAAGHRIIAIKASEGTSFVDPKHRGWALRAGMHHVAVVHYHFARPDLGTSPHDEAAHFLRAVGGLAGHHDYLVCDMERGLGGGFTHDPMWTRAFDMYVQEHTRFHTVLYASRSVLSISDEWLTGDRRRVWDADWSADRDFAPAGYTVAFRQFTDGVIGPGPHVAAGIGRCDMNRVGPAVLRALLDR